MINDYQKNRREADPKHWDKFKMLYKEAKDLK